MQLAFGGCHKENQLRAAPGIGVVPGISFRRTALTLSQRSPKRQTRHLTPCKALFGVGREGISLEAITPVDKEVTEADMSFGGRVFQCTLSALPADIKQVAPVR